MKTMIKSLVLFLAVGPAMSQSNTTTEAVTTTAGVTAAATTEAVTTTAGVTAAAGNATATEAVTTTAGVTITEAGASACEAGKAAAQCVCGSSKTACAKDSSCTIATSVCTPSKAEAAKLAKAADAAAKAAQAKAKAEKDAVDAELLRVKKVKADLATTPKPAIKTGLTISGLTAADNTHGLRTAVGCTFAALANTTCAKVFVNLATSRRRRQLTAADLKYAVLVQVENDAAASTMATAVGNVGAGAMKNQLQAEMAKDPILKAKKDSVTTVPDPVATVNATAVAAEFTKLETAAEAQVAAAATELTAANTAATSAAAELVTANAANDRNVLSGAAMAADVSFLVSLAVCAAVAQC